MKAIKFAATSIVLAAIFFSSFPSFAKDDFVENAKKVVADRMKDPESVKFRNLKTIKDDGLRLLCGDVNAKNSYGAYIGYAPFVSNPVGFVYIGRDSVSIQVLHDRYGKQCNFK